MRLLRRHSRSETGPVEGNLPDVTEVTPGSPAMGDGGELPIRFDLRATELGLIIEATDRPEHVVPALVPWSAVGSVSADQSTGTPDGTLVQRLDVRVVGGDWLGPEGTRSFLVPAYDVGTFLRAVPKTVLQTPPSHRQLRGSTARLVGSVAGVRDAVNARIRGGHPAPRHAVSGSGSDSGSDTWRIGPIVVGLLAVLLLAGSTSTSFGSSAGGASDSGGPSDVGNRAQAIRVHAVSDLPVATTAPAPAPPSLAASPPLQSHEIFGYAPYWTLPQSSGFDVKDLTTLAYFSVDANADGTLDESGAGWNGYESQDLVNLVTRSHAAGDRVVLTVTCFSQSSLNAITSDPNAAARLSSALIAAVSAKSLDGVNFDFEGEGSADRAGLTALITQVSHSLHAANPHWQVTMATYASAASDSAGFYDVAALAPALDGFFVMAYDMNDRNSPSATAPLTGGGYNDVETLQQFTAVVPPSKVILGVPYYGYDWPTTNGTNTAQATGPESPLSDAVIAASGHPTYWDPTTQTAWTAYQVGNQWHETYFDNPQSLALKAQAADFFHIGGVGIWALGMDGNDPAMLAALLGNSPAVKDLQTGPTVTTTPTAPVGTGFTTTGTYHGATVPLTPVVPPTNYGTVQYLGTLTGLKTTAPALSCLQGGTPISVWTFSAFPGLDVAVAATPENCAAAMFTFPPPAGGSSSSSTTTTSPKSTTTTSPKSTTTTTPASTTTAPTTTTTTAPVTTTTTVPDTTTTTG